MLNPLALSSLRKACASLPLWKSLTKLSYSLGLYVHNLLQQLQDVIGLEVSLQFGDADVEILLLLILRYSWPVTPLLAVNQSGLYQDIEEFSVVPKWFIPEGVLKVDLHHAFQEGVSLNIHDIIEVEFNLFFLHVVGIQDLGGLILYLRG